MNDHAEIGIFSALLEPARELALKILRGDADSNTELESFPGFFVTRVGEELVGAVKVKDFEVEGTNFLLFEKSGHHAD